VTSIKISSINTQEFLQRFMSTAHFHMPACMCFEQWTLMQGNLP